MIYDRNLIFVFGSNLAGRHGAGAAKYAFEHCGAVYGCGVGLYGNSYAIPTKDFNIKTLDLHTIAGHISDFLEFADNRTDLIFFVTPIGCGLAGYKREEISHMFKRNRIPSNVVFTKEWME